MALRGTAPDVSGESETDRRRRHRIAYAERHPGRVKESQKACYAKHGLSKRLRNRYNLTIEQYDEMLNAQGGHCALCPATTYDSKGKRLAVDHDHVTGKVRGLLCYACNSLLGKAGDDPDRLEKAAAYVRGHSRKTETEELVSAYVEGKLC